MKMVKKKFRSYEQHQLQQISDMVCDNIEELLNILGITEYKLLNNMVSMSCPIHGGDNVSACNLYYTGDSYRGNWKCRTHQCEQIFKPSILGFIRGCLSHSQNNWTHNGDNMVSFNDAIEFATKLTMTIKEFITVNASDCVKKNLRQYINPAVYIDVTLF